MKASLFAFLFVFSALATAQEGPGAFDTLKYSLEGKKLAEKELTPAGFSKSALAKGDLNKDGIADIALLIHNKETEDVPQPVLLFLGDKAGFRLIGITVNEIDRSCACGSSMDYNLMTGLKISSTDQDGNRQQMEKEIVTREKGKPEIILWDDFNHDNQCVTH